MKDDPSYEGAVAEVNARLTGGPAAYDGAEGTMAGLPAVIEAWANEALREDRFEAMPGGRVFARVPACVGAVPGARAIGLVTASEARGYFRHCGYRTPAQ